MAAKLQHHVWTVNGQPTEVLELAATSAAGGRGGGGVGGAHCDLLIIPGYVCSARP